jgi:hypothetical protein
MDEFRLLTQNLYNIVIAVYQKMVGFKNNKKKKILKDTLYLHLCPFHPPTNPRQATGANILLFCQNNLISERLVLEYRIN